MCGICGILTRGGAAVDPPQLTGMLETLTHRGPDAQGEWVSSEVGLAHARLKIIDLSDEANQPMVSSDGRVVLVFNGEMYNYRDLRAELIGGGCEFVTVSDTEVLLQSYLRWGSACFERFDGIFACALWDARRGTLVLARDRLGVKPLYYRDDASSYSFASEVKALTTVCRQPVRLNRDALPEYLAFRHVAGDATLFKDVKRVPEGSFIEVTRKAVTCRSYWQLPQLREDYRVVEQPQQSLAAVLADTVRAQMMSDVPVGTLCSGGIDSSTVTALAARCSDRPIHTFSVSVPGSPDDESAAAQAVADWVGTIHHRLDARAADFAAACVAVTRANDEPVAHPNSVMIRSICKLAKDTGVTVLLTGEGADELFCGYEHLRVARQRLAYRDWWKVRSDRAVRRLGGVRSPHRYGRAMAALLSSDQALAVWSTAYMSPSNLSALLGSFSDDAFAWRLALAQRTGHLGLIESMRIQELLAYLPPLLNRQDKMSMDSAVESRVPFLGNNVVDWATARSPLTLVAGGEGKVPVRRAAEALLPPWIVHRPKVGFPLPLARWMREESALREMLLQLGEPSASIASLVCMPRVRSWLKDHMQGRGDFSEQLWILLSLELWMREWGVEP